jgi:hypothetical protein
MWEATMSKSEDTSEDTEVGDISGVIVTILALFCAVILLFGVYSILLAIA